MIIAIDVHYKKTYAKVVAVFFNWSDKKPKKVTTININNVKPYKSGEFYKRELPCIIEIFKKIDLSTIELIIVDGHVFVNNDKKYGLGAHLWFVLKEKIPIIGIAKRRFYNTENVSTELFRGKSKNPLYISCIGLPVNEMNQKVNLLDGEFRIPTILKFLDSLTKIK